ncbi:MAG: type II toxin-antitoxin system HicA family toxin [Candidatus Delongbacteria bacterium]|nr:type II toxin-antitoxin system HicA family toxin [Candidatus Delongbacteria bacterium]
MKRESLIKHLRKNGCQLLREGSKHSVYFNPSNDNQTTIPRHSELDNVICTLICKQLGIKKP